jgi:hypothetical protein
MVMGKSKGNKMERDTAKELSYWMFDDEHTLKREPTSGACKYNYCGDIFPMKQINWEHFPFLIETKTGYEQHSPTLWKYQKVLDWFNKSLQESHQHNQWIIFLICQFKNKPKHLFTNYQLNLEQIIPCSIIPNQTNNQLIWIYIYSFKNILEIEFLNLFGSEIKYKY